MDNVAQQLDQVLALAEKATPGKWAATVGGHVKQVGGVVIVEPNRMRGETIHANADFIAALANLIHEHGPAIRAAVGGEAVVAGWIRPTQLAGIHDLAALSRVGHQVLMSAERAGDRTQPLYASPPATVDVGVLREVMEFADRCDGVSEESYCAEIRNQLAALIGKEA